MRVTMVSWHRCRVSMSKLADRHPKNINIKFKKRFCLVIWPMVMLGIHFLLWFTPLRSRQKWTTPLHHDLTSKESYLLKILLSSTPIFNTFFAVLASFLFQNKVTLQLHWLISYTPTLFQPRGDNCLIFFHPKYCYLMLLPSPVHPISLQVNKESWIIPHGQTFCWEWNFV